MRILNKTQSTRTFFVCKSPYTGKYMRKYMRAYTADDIDNAEIFKQRGDAAKAKWEALDKDGIIVKIEVNIIE